MQRRHRRCSYSTSWSNFASPHHPAARRRSTYCLIVLVLSPRPSDWDPRGRTFLRALSVHSGSGALSSAACTPVAAGVSAQTCCLSLYSHHRRHAISARDLSTVTASNTAALRLDCSLTFSSPTQSYLVLRAHSSTLGILQPTSCVLCFIRNATVRGPRPRSIGYETH
ncbi:hypothetical protein EXIGLDRAFT_295350 [Exidia glandulosa HHB12029]|uniref:Uncharacterized protein n=1 Tax=Exidia glandulosa HHB12029 TaxID=1314781 RepID=A0A165DD48_EXIGL|nr:hypothetical protein EXIGLDRAFT_295350 [Exidia glandulosa HHB12029]